MHAKSHDSVLGYGMDRPMKLSLSSPVAVKSSEGLFLGKRTNLGGLLPGIELFRGC